MRALTANSLKTTLRQDIMDFQESLPSHPDVTNGIKVYFEGDSEICPLKHSFCDGIYVREIFIPAGTELAGKIHKHEHPNFLMSGEVIVVTESGGIERLIGPVAMISKAGTKRALRAITDLVWVTVHHNPKNFNDLDKLEDLIIAKNYDEYDKFKALGNGYFNRIGIFVKSVIKFFIK